ncbi:hypothetical protein B0T25DRAFT_262645 [Lasiosphaeria hispida]|uniref:DUF7730 domain-containing protein n=1 Tax=Lasiosphaeria hispida TaxID=260671 RepID=A0AAJ0MDG8_9PEZI|nr:hypothetical protein B0T25DRAFT_262645 [Lasiosphaeria hispida]
MQNIFGSLCGRRMPKYRHIQGHDPELRKLTPYEQSRIFDLKPLINQTDTSPQEDSLFFSRLPLEIRCHIYSFVIPKHRRLWVQRRLRSGKVPGGPDEDSHIEHFPVRQLPNDMTCSYTGGVCCLNTFVGFFQHLEGRVVFPHDDSLVLMSTCQRIYLELFPMWTYCFDSLDTMNAFTSITTALPIRHVQIMVYAHHRLYDPTFSWTRHTDGEWEKKLERVSAACQRIPGLASVLLSIQPQPQFAFFMNMDAVLDSCRQLTVSSRVHTEILGRQGDQAMRLQRILLSGEGFDVSARHMTQRPFSGQPGNDFHAT